MLLLAGAGAVALSLRRRAVLATTVDLPSFDSALADELPSFEEHPMLEGSPVVAAPIRSAADLTREQMIEYVTTVAQENPGQSRQTRQTMAGGVSSLMITDKLDHWAVGDGRHRLPKPTVSVRESGCSRR